MKENRDATDTNVATIEKDIINAQHFIDSIKTDKEYKEENGWHGYYNKEIVELARILQHILSDYKRVLKENEILKEEKEQAWEEWNNLEQGSYETEQKIKQQIKKLQKENEELKADNYELNNRINDLLDNISVQKVKDRIEKYKKLSDKFYVKFLESDRYNTDIREKGIKCDAIILALEELIEEREEK